jgi:hypothetical protein
MRCRLLQGSILKIRWNGFGRNNAERWHIESAGASRGEMIEK